MYRLNFRLNNVNNFMAGLFVLAPLASNFSLLGSVSFGDFFVLLFIGSVFFKDNKVRISLLLFILSLFSFSFILLCSYLESYPPGIASLARLSFYLFSCIYLARQCKDCNFNIVNVYLLFSVLFSLLLIVQLIAYHIFGVFFVYFNLNIEVEKNALLILDLAEQGFRSGGVFREPSYYSIFMAPALAYFALYRRYMMWFFSAISVFLSTSALGFVFIILSFFYIFKIKLRYLVFLIAFIALFFAIPGVINVLPARVVETMSGDGSLIVRVTYPFYAVFIEASNVFYPNVILLKNMAEPGSLIWLNSLCYLVAVFGISVIAPLILILYYVGIRWIVYLLILIFTTHSMSTPYFVFMVVMFVSLCREMRK